MPPTQGNIGDWSISFLVPKKRILSLLQFKRDRRPGARAWDSFHWHAPWGGIGFAQGGNGHYLARVNKKM